MTEAKTKILVVDDDVRLRDLLNRYLTEQGFTVRAVADATDMNRQLARERYDLMILDLMLPGEDGLSICRRLRGGGEKMPIIMLTAKGDDVDRIVGLEIGADDYLAKPFNARELLARMHAVLRRSQAAEAAAAAALAAAGGAAGPTGSAGAASGSDGVLAVGDVVIDVRARTVRRGGELVELTSLEFDLLKVLVAAAGDVVSREVLFEQVLRREYNVFDRSIDNHVSSLRKKLGPRVGDAERIRSIRNAGYAYART
jgi:two-component system phosphate regulon response regulator OmpR